MGVFARGNVLWIRYKDASGDWKSSSTGYPLHERKKAARLYREVTARIAAGQEVDDLEGPVTVARWIAKWEKTRTHADAGNEKQRLRDHVTPVIGPMPLGEVRPRHIAEVVLRLRAEGKAPKTIRNVYTAITALFRSAQLHDLVEASPCILRRQELGEIEDSKQGWRATAVYNRNELERLISDERIDEDRRMLYALEGIGGVRHGEAAGLQWLHYDAELKPLGRLTVARSYDKTRTKTGRTRLMPVHPVLAAMLADWRLRGWSAMMGRQPKPEDLIIPTPKGSRTKLGSMRSKNYSGKLFAKDLVLLGLRHRRGHDLRRTMISLARSDGARKDLLELCTHTPKKDAAIDLYTTIEWPIFCAEIAKLQVSRRPPHEVVELPKAANGSGGLVTSPVTVDSDSAKNSTQNEWRRRESNPSRSRSGRVGRDAPVSVRSMNADGSTQPDERGGSVDVGPERHGCNECNEGRETRRERGRFIAGRALRGAVSTALAGDEEGTLELLQEAARALRG
jgi:integrase